MANRRHAEARRDGFVDATLEPPEVMSHVTAIAIPRNESHRGVGPDLCGVEEYLQPVEKPPERRLWPTIRPRKRRFACFDKGSETTPDPLPMLREKDLDEDSSPRSCDHALFTARGE